jgi:hypothetical protein
MELDLQSLFGLHVCSCTHWLRPRNPRPPPIPLHFGSYTRALLVSQERRHLFVTPWKNMFESIPKVGEWIKQVDCDMDGKLSYKEKQHWNLI